MLYMKTAQSKTTNEMFVVCFCLSDYIAFAGGKVVYFAVFIDFADDQEE